MSPLPIVGVFLDKHTFDLIGKSLDVNDIYANLEDIFYVEIILRRATLV